MLTFHKFIESKKEEDLEEKSGLDLDHDHEKGESPAHKEKVEKKHKEMIDFFTKRQQGAREILSRAKSKDTKTSQLTIWHFSAKVSEYFQIITAIKTNKSKSYFESKYRLALEKLKNKNIDQKSFQMASAHVECWGETISQLFN